MTGMTRDMSVSRFNANLAFDARNIRITAQGEDSTLLSVTNEKGTKHIDDFTVKGTVIGTASFADTLVVFTTGGEAAEGDLGPDRIYTISQEGTTPSLTCLFSGDLNFNVKYPLETLAIVENSFIKKVYWVDGQNQPRMINIENGVEENPDKFNFVRQLEHLDATPTQIEVTRNPSGGHFPPGTIQYCFTYFDKFGQQTAPVDVSPLYYLSPTDRGLPADGTASNSFTLALKNLDTNFEYVRIYAIVRTQEGATPTVRIVGDYSTKDATTYPETGELAEVSIPQANLENFGIGPDSLKDILGNREIGIDIPFSDFDISTTPVYINHRTKEEVLVINPAGLIQSTLSDYISLHSFNTTVTFSEKLLIFDTVTCKIYVGVMNETHPDPVQWDFVADIFDDDTDPGYHSYTLEGGYSTGHIYEGTLDTLTAWITLQDSDTYLSDPVNKLQYWGENSSEQRGVLLVPQSITNQDGATWNIEGSNQSGYHLFYSQGERKDLIISDSGQHGELVDSTLLLFMLGHKITAETLAAKDNTLFLGNLIDKSPTIGDKIVDEEDAKTLAELARGFTTKSIYVDYNGKPYSSQDSTQLITKDNDYYPQVAADNQHLLQAHKEGTPGASFYDYKLNNNRNSKQLKSFKSDETYRLGFIAQDSQGRWSEVIWVDDVKETLRPCRTALSKVCNDITDPDAGFYYSCSGIYANTGFQVTIPSKISKFLHQNNYKKIAPVVIYPTGADRTILAQGILAGTVYNVGDRCDNSPFVQADWRFRIGYSWEAIRDEVQTCSGPADDTINRESNKVSPNTPKAFDTSGNVLKDGDFENLFKEHFYRDPSIITFHSPDIEFDDSIKNGDFLDTKLRIVGFSTLGFAEGDDGDSDEGLGLDYASGLTLAPGRIYEPEFHRAAILKTSTPGFADFATTEDITKTYIDFVKWNDPDEDYYPSVDQFKALQFSGFLDLASGYKADSGNYDGTLEPKAIVWLQQETKQLIGFHWLTYLWHRNGSLNNQPPLTTAAKKKGTIRTATLERKCISELRYSRTFWQGPKSSIKIEAPKLVDSDQNTMVKITQGGKSLSYYGNIDKVLVPNTVKIQWKNTADGPTYTADKTDGYVVRPLSIEYVTQKSEDSNTNPAARFANYITNQFRPVTGLQSYLGSACSDFNVSKDPVYMRYKSTRHLVIPLAPYKDSMSGDMVYRTVIPTTAYPFTNIQDFFWIEGLGTECQGIDFEYNHNTTSNCHVYIADLYRDFTPEQQAARFGGTTKEALAAADWYVCGSPKAITADSGDITLDYVEGDTYVMRYDCLKTYPYTQEDPNSIVSIFSTELETRVNLDFRYDRNRGLEDNTLVTPQNFNLLNRPAYEQTNEYFTYHALDYDRYKKLEYPNMITWSLEKTNGEDVDTWCAIPLTSTMDLDGEKGEVTALKLFNNEIFCFQQQGLSQILFNSRVQIPTSDGQPIEITNGYKVQGKRYLTTNVGVTNKWSIASTQNGLYFIDDERNSLYRLNGQGLEDLSTKLGFRTWLAENNSYGVWSPVDYTNLRTFYDKVNMDLYFTTKKEALVFSEQIGNFISFMDYGGVETMFNLNDKFYTFTQGEAVSDMWEFWGGDYNTFFGEFKPYWLGFVANADPTYDKVFNTLEWRTIDYTDVNDEGQGTLAPLATFDTVRVWNNHQDTGNVELINTPGKPSVLKKKFNVFRSWVPRDKKGQWAPSGRDRIRNPWTYIQLSRYKENTDLMQFTDMSVDYFL